MVVMTGLWRVTRARRSMVAVLGAAAARGEEEVAAGGEVLRGQGPRAGEGARPQWGFWGVGGGRSFELGLQGG